MGPDGAGSDCWDPAKLDRVSRRLMQPAKAEWEAGLSADAVLRDQCLSVGLQEPFSSRQETRGGGEK